ncbi:MULTISPECIES: hypothetical protein [Sorangium]|uniref:Sorangium cellulosum 'So ce 56' complete genome n=1 Tax=Sorangium cellulosum (strain So ce56) TaxID=448385 RepID=A9F501_SORC5|nr:hypothetical protein [Sorangium cellulosum]CAN97759.1 unnamed protein product [Sorangium cellulosum So ce56]
MSEATDNTATDHAEAQAEVDRPNNSLIFVIVIATLLSIVVTVLFVNEIFKATMEREISTKVLEPPSSGVRSLRAWEKERLSHYQWADEKKGVVRIPVDQAVALTLKDYQEKRVRTAAAPAATTEPAQPADGAAKPAEGAAAGEPSKGEDAAKPGDKDAAKPSDAAKPAETATPAKPAETAKPADAVKPEKPADGAVKPAAPAGAAPKPAAPATPAPEQ